MKITELKKLLANSDNDSLKKAIVGTYKLLPSGKKDEADFAIKNVLGCDV